jgi:stress response protein YsnF
MLTEREVSASIGGTACSSSGDKIGTVEHFFVDDRTGAPSWVAVTTGLFGTRHSIVPATEATFADGVLRLPVSADAVKSAPHLRGDHLSPEEEDRLRRHYGLLGTSSGPPPWTPTGDGLRPPGTEEGPAAADQGVPPAADGGMVRSEEQLRTGTERVASTRWRLVKYVVTEEVQITVPIRREEIRVEEVPIDAIADASGESLVADEPSGLPDEIVLHTERPVVSVEVVPRERVRLRTELVQGQETVTEQVQREEIVVDETPSSNRINPR